MVKGSADQVPGEGAMIHTPAFSKPEGPIVLKSFAKGMASFPRTPTSFQLLAPSVWMCGRRGEGRRHHLQLLGT